MATEAPRRGRPPKNQRESRVEPRLNVEVGSDDFRDHGNVLIEEVELIPGHAQFHLAHLRKMFRPQDGYELEVLANGNVKKTIKKEDWLKIQDRDQQEAIRKSKSEAKYSGEGVIRTTEVNNARFERYTGE